MELTGTRDEIVDKLKDRILILEIQVDSGKVTEAEAREIKQLKNQTKGLEIVDEIKRLIGDSDYIVSKSCLVPYVAHIDNKLLTFEILENSVKVYGKVIDNYGISEHVKPNSKTYEMNFRTVNSNSNKEFIVSINNNIELSDIVNKIDRITTEQFTHISNYVKMASEEASFAMKFFNSL